MHKSQQKSDDEQLTAGFMAAKADRQLDNDADEIGVPDFVVPEEIKREFLNIDVEEIRQKIAEAKALGVAATISLGFAYMALKTKLRKKFKETLRAEGGHAEYLAAHRAMCRARAWMVIPEVAERLGVEPIRKLMALSSDDIQAIRTKLIGAPPDLARTITEKELDRAYDRIQRKKQTGRFGGKGRKNLEIAAEDLPDQLDAYVAQLKGLLIKIYELKIPVEKHERARFYANELQLAWDRAAYNLRDPEHRTTPIFKTHPMHDEFAEGGS